MLVIRLIESRASTPSATADPANRQPNLAGR
jgi:hypothetical protein